MDTRPCLIIGASGNIGEAIAHRLVKEGRPVALTHSPRTAPLASLPEADGALKWYSVDVRNSQSINELVAAVQKDFKATPDLVYAAGVTKDASLALSTDEAWDTVIGINLTGAFYAARALCRPLMMTQNGRIIFLGSVTAAVGNPGQINYAATKGAMESMCRVIAAELGRFGVTCNVVAPGAIDSRMLRELPEAGLENFKKSTPLRRLGTTGEVASLVSYILSEESQYITGQTIYIDGGLSAV